jgi:hypothetical protein
MYPPVNIYREQGLENKAPGAATSQREIFLPPKKAGAFKLNWIKNRAAFDPTLSLTSFETLPL